MVDATPDTDKIDDAVMSLLYLTAVKDGECVRAWKSFDWDAMNRLNERGFISNPKTKAKSIVLTDQGQRRAEALFKKLFCKT